MYYIGLDISKTTISVYIPKIDKDIEIENSIKAIRSLYSKLKKVYKKDIEGVVFVYEPTANYSSILKRFCSEKNIKVFLINPKQSSNFAKAIAQRGKSDKADARMLSHAGIIAKDDEIVVPVINHLVEEIKELMAYYKIKVKHRVGLSNHLESLSAKQNNSTLVNKVQKELDKLKKDEKEIIEEIYQLIKKDTTLHDKYKAIISIDGIGKIVAIALIHLFVKYPNANQREIVSLIGLDPIKRESGTSIRGKTRISKAGGKIYRGGLFMAAMVAIRYNENMKQFYNRLKENHKHTTVAQVAVMRKLVIIAHSLFKSGELYDENKYLQETSSEKLEKVA